VETVAAVEVAVAVAVETSRQVATVEQDQEAAVALEQVLPIQLAQAQVLLMEQVELVVPLLQEVELVQQVQLQQHLETVAVAEVQGAHPKQVEEQELLDSLLFVTAFPQSSALLHSRLEQQLLSFVVNQLSM
jgi:hypothetical protein